MAPAVDKADDAIFAKPQLVEARASLDELPREWRRGKGAA
jgi:hypothetical protein